MTHPSGSSHKRVLITGGAGFIGSNLCIALATRHPEWDVVACDNLFRRGSELNLPRLRTAGVSFVHGDVRQADDLTRIGPIDALVECSAEPSVMASVDGATDYVVQTNLMGAYRCLELAARHGAQLIFLSTSRVYPVAALEAMPVVETDDRYELVDSDGVSEAFPLTGARTLYGATKLAAELLVAEFADTHGIPTVVNRCGVVAGPWQMGKVDQGVFTHWMLSHHRGDPLRYIGYGGTGKQVRDLLHVDDLVELVELQLADPAHWAGTTFNVGGGRAGSLSLRETTALCARIAGREVPVTSAGETRPGDVRVYLSDCSALYAHTSWRPTRGPEQVLADISTWITANEALVLSALG
ncbi:NAD-dependent epimerase/dehydratase family protein [Paraconexibacter antarcticus]|uniref:NAD-dependent epimerase/dehydratase family protein n=1 Tax=Paraconexibacter antarcticus TaxID=2949664 RepID=A0ABY5DVG8_9ACTN|nr:NAD-dependent epimerase/dehydratase family protein [Paraconexibacter antarcticus]UTI65062.1 NAD-dependent epimerase/dehydratase family protein [Paraconexibacter antarcticus]